MPHGFMGNAAHKYLSSVSSALSSAHAVHSKNPHGGGGSVAPPALPMRNNVNAKNPPESAMSGGYPLRYRQPNQYCCERRRVCRNPPKNTDDGFGDRGRNT